MHIVPAAAIAAIISLGSLAQEVVEVPASKANVARPDDLFGLPPGQWFAAKSLALGSEQCLPDQCEAGFTSGDLVISVEHAKDFVQVIAGFRGCERTAFSELQVGAKPGKPTFSRVAKQVERVVEGAAKSCNVSAPEVPKLDVATLFPRPG